MKSVTHLLDEYISLTLHTKVLEFAAAFLEL